LYSRWRTPKLRQAADPDPSRTREVHLSSPTLWALTPVMSSSPQCFCFRTGRPRTARGRGTSARRTNSWSMLGVSSFFILFCAPSGALEWSFSRVCLDMPCPLLPRGLRWEHTLGSSSGARCMCGQSCNASAAEGHSNKLCVRVRVSVLTRVCSHYRTPV
jgi:hypothetical protein